MNNQKIIVQTLLCICTVAALCYMQQSTSAQRTPQAADKNQQLLQLCRFAGEDDETVRRIKRLLRNKNIQVNVTDSADTPLLLAVERNHLKKARLLLAAGADPNIPSADGHTALSIAVANSNLEMVRLLLGQQQQQEQQPQLQEQQPQLLSERAMVYADPNYITPHGEPLLIVAAQTKYPALVESLLQAGANPNVLSASGDTALMVAARNGSALTIEALLQYHADTNAADTSENRTALMWAIVNNHLEAATLLINAGTDLNKRDIDGDTAADFVRKLYPNNVQWMNIFGLTP